ncbi:hypothetical protein OAQ15_01945 [Flavobacteriaceae bacterium]|nr:hypothetical protein [Flavobacteriaceae bacterium]
MNQLKLFLLIILFVHSKMGMALNFHYCGDHLVQISFALNPKGCGMETSKTSYSDTLSFSQKNCCADEVEIFQNKGEISFIDDFNGFDFEISGSNSNYSSKNYSTEDPQLFQFHPRPPPLQTNLYRLYSSFLFYD